MSTSAPDSQYQQNQGISNQYRTKTDLSEFNPYVGDISINDLAKVTRDTGYQYLRTGKATVVNFKTPVHELLDSLFTFEEKWLYLQSMGYRPNNNAQVDVGEYTMVEKKVNDNWSGLSTANDAFYHEMTIKLKNTLLSKGALKFKI